MTPDLDVMTGLLCIWMAVCACFVLVFSAPHRRKWMNIPEYVRITIRLMVVAMVWRGVNFLSLAGQPDILPGRANVEALLGYMALASFISALTFWIGTAVLPDKAWERLDWVRTMLRAKPTARPLVIEESEVVEIAHASGIPAVSGTAGKQAVYEEAPRYAREIERAYS